MLKAPECPKELLHPGSHQIRVLQLQAVGLVLGPHDAHTAVFSANRTAGLQACC